MPRRVHLYLYLYLLLLLLLLHRDCRNCRNREEEMSLARRAASLSTGGRFGTLTLICLGVAMIGTWRCSLAIVRIW